MKYIKLKNKLKEKKLLQEVFAKEIGMSRMSFHRKMYGISDWSLSETKEISKKLGLNMYEYLDIFDIFFNQ